MLKLFRQRKLAVRISLTGVDFGLGDPQGALARVDEVVITSDDARREFNRQARQLGGSAAQLRPFLMQQVVDNLITQRALVFEANRLGLKAPPEEVQARLRQVSMLYPGGQFVGADAYRALIQSQMGMSVPEFEQGLRRQLLVDKLAMWVTGGVSVSPDEIEQEYRRQNERAQIEYVEFPAAGYAAQVQPSEEDLQAYYQANLARYQQPERRVVRFVPIDYEELGRRLSVTPQELEDFYRSNQNDYQLPERVRVRHILFLRDPAGPIALGDTGEAEAGEEAAEGAADPLREEAQQVLEQLRQGVGFAGLAAEHSDDQATRESGGEIGWVQRNQTVPELEQMLFSVPSGSEPQQRAPAGRDQLRLPHCSGDGAPGGAPAAVGGGALGNRAGVERPEGPAAGPGSGSQHRRWCPRGEASGRGCPGSRLACAGFAPLRPHRPLARLGQRERVSGRSFPTPGSHRWSTRRPGERSHPRAGWLYLAPAQGGHPGPRSPL
jgi:parvulin-like peptidyl-prolyl isomerase